MTILRQAKRIARNARSSVRAAALSYPRMVRCNMCGWEGRHFLSSFWHQHTTCPLCESGVRQRLLCAALEFLDTVSYAALIDGKRVLHFAPEDALGAVLARKAARYVTADLLRGDADLAVDMSSMPEVDTHTFDVVIACDVLEHVPDYRAAIDELRRVLVPSGTAILTVPQKDRLASTFEDSSVTTPEERTRYFGQQDHLRIFGDDFGAIVETRGFSVTAVDDTAFPPAQRERFVLRPPVLSTHPLATNYRKVFFCRTM